MIGTNNQELISQVIAGFTRDNDALIDQLVKLEYYFRGSLTRDDVWQLTPYEREKRIEFLNTRFEDAQKLIKNDVAVFL